MIVWLVVLFFNINTNVVEYQSRMQYRSISECRAAEVALTTSPTLNARSDAVLVETSCYGESAAPKGLQQVPR